MKGCHSFLPTILNSVKVHSKRTPTALPCCSVTLRQESPCCPTLMESTQRPSVRQPVSCNVLWVERWVGVMSQKSSDRGEAMWRNLASISVCNRSSGDLHGAWNLLRYDRFLDQFMSSYLCVNSAVRLLPEIFFKVPFKVAVTQMISCNRWSVGGSHRYGLYEASVPVVIGTNQTHGQHFSVQML